MVRATQKRGLAERVILKNMEVMTMELRLSSMQELLKRVTTKRFDVITVAAMIGLSVFFFCELKYDTPEDIGACYDRSSGVVVKLKELLL